MIKLSCSLLLIILNTGCSTLSWYQHVAEGQMELLSQRRPIDEVLNDKSVSATVHAKLKLVQSARKFATQKLLLPDNKSYNSYADLGRPYALWNVFATQPLSLNPKQWCHPFVGCISYRNYYAQIPAQLYADELSAQGLDVYVGGASAFSTLGWFEDPVLSTMLRWEDYDLVGTLFHEMAHEMFYIKGETALNESLAKAVEQEGLHRWMKSHAKPEEFKKYRNEIKQKKQFVAMVLKIREQLEVIYASEKNDEEKLIAKRDSYRQLRKNYIELRKQWGGNGAYDRWVFSGVNNAKIQAVATYYDYVPFFRRMIVESGGDLARFYQQLDKLVAMGKHERQLFINDRTFK